MNSISVPSHSKAIERERFAAPATLLSAANRIVGTVFLTIMASAALYGQQPTPGEKTRAGSRAQTYNAPGATYTGKGGDYQVDPQKAKAVVSSINLEKRTITVVPATQGGTFKVAELVEKGRVWREVEEMEMTFAMPIGLEKIQLSKTAASSLGKKSISLEELPLRAEIKIEYYPVPRMVLAMTVERISSK